MMEQQEILRRQKASGATDGAGSEWPDMIQQLVWGETGTFVRRLLWEEENE